MSARVDRAYGLVIGAYLTAAAVTGVACVGFMRAFELALARRVDFASSAVWPWLAAPAGFLLCVELIRRAAPFAAGTGIPQAVFAAERMSETSEARLRPLVSTRTLAVKAATLLLAVAVGASTGREGPTVHVAVCVFVAVMLAFRRLSGLKIDLRSAVVAGAAAGLGAAFNTPLAGVTFAIEELSTDYFHGIKDFVLLAIIVAAIAAKALTGEYAYFGRLPDPPGLPLAAVIVIGLTGAFGGAAFSGLLIAGGAAAKRLARGAGRFWVPVAAALGLMALARFSGTGVLGPGNAAAQKLVEGQFGRWAFAFPAEKMLATLLTYWSGIAGGIFAPCLAIGAAVGADFATLFSAPVSSCALVGMAAFLSGTIQAPITSFVIIFEMTGHHSMLLPIMLASLLAYMGARLIGARHFYQTLADGYAPLLDGLPE